MKIQNSEDKENPKSQYSEIVLFDDMEWIEMIWKFRFCCKNKYL